MGEILDYYNNNNNSQMFVVAIETMMMESIEIKYPSSRYKLNLLLLLRPLPLSLPLAPSLLALPPPSAHGRRLAFATEFVPSDRVCV